MYDVVDFVKELPTFHAGLIEQVVEQKAQLSRISQEMAELEEIIRSIKNKYSPNSSDDLDELYGQAQKEQEYLAQALEAIGDPAKIFDVAVLMQIDQKIKEVGEKHTKQYEDIRGAAHVA